RRPAVLLRLPGEGAAASGHRGPPRWRLPRGRPGPDPPRPRDVPRLHRRRRVAVLPARRRDRHHRRAAVATNRGELMSTSDVAVRDEDLPAERFAIGPTATVRALAD